MVIFLLANSLLTVASLVDEYLCSQTSSGVIKTLSPSPPSISWQKDMSELYSISLKRSCSSPVA
eukprot:XP_001710164.1 Hypothetical protein GL50803_30795 [Giardia lamblia ATCC 50803]